MNLLVTGSAGFIGSAFVRMLLGKVSHPKAPYPLLETGKIVSLDLLTYSGCLRNLHPIAGNSRYVFVQGDIRDQDLVKSLVQRHQIDTIVNFAAESHVDRSIDGSRVFAETNVLGTLSLLEVAKESRLRFLQVPTDEVYGSLGDTGAFTEETPLAPNSPYSASKAAADCFVRSYVHTHQLHAVITRCSNNYGPYQFPEKLLPVAITRLMNKKRIPVYGNGKNVRDWLHVEDHCFGIWVALTRGEPGAVYNIGGGGEQSNLEMVTAIARHMGVKSSDAFEFVEDRKGHDWRYAINSDRLKSLGWRAHWTLDEGLGALISWYTANCDWWQEKLPQKV